MDLQLETVEGQAVLCPPGKRWRKQPCCSSNKQLSHFSTNRAAVLLLLHASQLTSRCIMNHMYILVLAYHAERVIPVDWLTLKRALKEEVAANTPAGSTASSSSKNSKRQQLFADVLKLLELLTLLQYSEDAQYVQAAMQHVCPELTAKEQQLLAKSRSSFSDEAVDEQQLEQEVLDAVVKLLLRARYTPLTQKVA